VPGDQCGPCINSSPDLLHQVVEHTFAGHVQGIGQRHSDSKMSTHCVLRVVDPVSRLVRALLRRLQISHLMASLAAASASPAAALPQAVVSASPAAALPQAAASASPVAALHLHQALALRPLLLVQELPLQLRQPAEQWPQPEEPRLA
jgi:hypothetical protein